MKWWISILLCVRIGGAEIPFGAHATLRATANGKPAPSYEWFRDGVKVGAEANLPITSATAKDAGMYVCRAQNGIGPGASSTPIEVTIAVAPRITSSFPNVDIVKGRSYTLAVTAYGAGLAYKWKKGGKIIAGQTLPTFTISSAKPPDAGTYACEVSNVAGTVEASCKVTVVNK